MDASDDLDHVRYISISQIDSHNVSEITCGIGMMTTTDGILPSGEPKFITPFRHSIGKPQPRTRGRAVRGPFSTHATRSCLTETDHVQIKASSSAHLTHGTVHRPPVNPLQTAMRDVLRTISDSELNRVDPDGRLLRQVEQDQLLRMCLRSQQAVCLARQKEREISTRLMELKSSRFGHSPAALETIDTTVSVQEEVDMIRARAEERTRRKREREKLRELAELLLLSSEQQDENECPEAFADADEGGGEGSAAENASDQRSLKSRVTARMFMRRKNAETLRPLGSKRPQQTYVRSGLASQPPVDGAALSMADADATVWSERG